MWRCQGGSWGLGFWSSARKSRWRSAAWGLDPWERGLDVVLGVAKQGIWV